MIIFESLTSAHAEVREFIPPPPTQPTERARYGHCSMFAEMFVVSVSW